MIADHLLLGREGEDAAAAHLASRGYEVLERNWRTPRGEVDLICRHGDTLVFVEVKTRGQGSLAAGTDAVHGRKRSRLLRAAAEYLSAGDLWARPCRFDVVSVVRHGASLRVEHLEDAFRADFERSGGRGWQPW